MRNLKRPGCLSLIFLSSLIVPAAFARLETYKIDPAHTYPAFETDHMGGLSLWRGKINSTSGAITLDTKAKSGGVDVLMDMRSIDFGNQDMNDRAKEGDILDVEGYPSAHYVGRLVFEDDDPVGVQGHLTLLGITKPVDLSIKSFKCMFHPVRLKRVCGADAFTTIRRDDFGVDYAKYFGFKMDVTLRISVEAFRVRSGFFSD